MNSTSALSVLLAVGLTSCLFLLNGAGRPAILQAPQGIANLTATIAHSQLLVAELTQQLAALNASLPAVVQHTLADHLPAVLSKVAQNSTKPRKNPKPAHHVGQARSACDKRGASGLQLEITDKLIAPVVIVAYNRVHYLGRAFMSILRYWSADDANAQRFPLFVSVDGSDPATTAFAAALHLGARVQVIHNLRDSSRCKPKDGYCNLAIHYHMLMELFFTCHHAPRLLFLEEDLEIAPDFFSYFTVLAPVLDADPSILCISAWNDHGQAGRASSPTALYRTDIFPGLGWMTTAAIGKELHPKWPDGYWDDWLRLPENRKGRQCVFPEVPRTHTFGRDGTSGGVLFDQHLKPMLLNMQLVEWNKQDVSFLRNSTYAQLVSSWLHEAEEIKADAVGQYCRVGQPDDASTSRDLVVRYTDINNYKQLAQQLAPMLPDLQGGKQALPRASYNGVVVVRCRGRRLFVAPSATNIA